LLMLAVSPTDEKNDKIKVMIRGKIEEYLARAETLKTHLTSDAKPGKKAVGANGAGKK
jgi:vacuolar protein-sorting-associated protein 4